MVVHDDRAFMTAGQQLAGSLPMGLAINLLTHATQCRVERRQYFLQIVAPFLK